MSRVNDGVNIAGYHETCTLCGDMVWEGAMWVARFTNVAACRRCLSDGQFLGALIGDAARDARDIERMLDAVTRHAWRAHTLANEWESPESVAERDQLSASIRRRRDADE